MKFRHEYKHIINMPDIIQLRSRLDILFRRDSHCGTDGSYFVKSLYFDNYTDTALREKLDGTDKREKFRIRFYNTDTSFIRLEKKVKVNGLCSKESIRITAEECKKIINGDTAFMLDSPHNLLRELYSKMHYRLLRPRCIVGYRRECFIHPAGNVRITLDSGICGSYCTEKFLNSDLKLLPLCQTSVLEVKWDEYLPQIVRDTVQLKNRQSSSFSKYAAVRF